MEDHGPNGLTIGRSVIGVCMCSVYVHHMVWKEYLRTGDDAWYGPNVLGTESICL